MTVVYVCTNVVTHLVILSVIEMCLLCEPCGLLCTCLINVIFHLFMFQIMIQTITHVPRMRLCAARMLARMQHVWCIRATDVCTTYVDVCIKMCIRAAYVYIRAAYVDGTYAACGYVCRTYVDLCWRSGPNVLGCSGDAVLRTSRACCDMRAT